MLLTLNRAIHCGIISIMVDLIIIMGRHLLLLKMMASSLNLTNVRRVLILST